MYKLKRVPVRGGGGGLGGTPFNGLYGEAPPERGTFLSASFSALKKSREKSLGKFHRQCIYSR